MAHVWRESRVKETSTTTGTGAFTLAGAVTGARAFSAVCSVNDTVDYVIEGGSEWERGIGTYSGANTLTRTKVLRSSNSNNAVNFSAGTKNVFIPAAGYDAPTTEVRDQVTAAVSYYATWSHNTSGAAAADFGIGQKWALESTTTEDTVVAEDTIQWVVATHASRTVRRKHYVYDTAARETIREESDGTQALIGLFGAVDTGWPLNVNKRTLVTSSRASGEHFKVAATQTAPNAGGGEGCANYTYTLTASSATNQGQTLHVYMEYNQSLTGGGHLTDLQVCVFNLNFNTGTTTDSVDCFKVAVSTQDGTVTAFRGFNVSQMFGTSVAAFVSADDSAGTNRTHILIGTETIPSGTYTIYSTSTSASQLAGNLTLGSGADLIFSGTTGQSEITFTDNLADALSVKITGGADFLVFDSTDSAEKLTILSGTAQRLGFHGATPVAKQTVTGSRGGNAALASLLTQLANLGLITDSTTA